MLRLFAAILILTSASVPVFGSPQPERRTPGAVETPGSGFRILQQEDVGEDIPGYGEGVEDEKERPALDARISNDMEALPEPVRLLRENMLEAARTGEIERLKPFLDAAKEPVIVSFGGDSDPIPFWREMSGDGEGIEVLSIMIEILNTGYAVLDEGTDRETYVWPYFYAVPFDDLTKPQLVELFKLITPYDMEDMRSFGGYIFYRLGISREGEWVFFVAGD